ncbi:SOS response-associated peptidase [Roseibium denhamense]|uniref:Abasic site processing protein n=1 Tax=Roseibium denhamense TaxID=76305 RepID=A0ABY1P3Z5_9HYPH|nr:SOS response-associated peptidase [Roseibium denhamense]MTI05194.1 SOS response-associated peptidase [Roseibium denhamense]SMP25806.1 Putative SOS response-associated peptidase YedK [Roseibium denhamense]
MCGRFSLTATPEEVRALFGYIDQPNFPPRYNIAPTQPVATVRQEHGRRRFQLIRWGLIPSWVKDPASFTVLINARAETAAQKPSFRAAMRHHRCIFPASGFYEWRRTPDGKQPFWIHPADGGVMAMAGLWDTWSDPDGGDMDSGAMLTIESNKMMSEIHHRMPVILKPESFDAWLDTANIDVRQAQQMLLPIEDDYLVATPVSSRVNKVVNDDPELQVEVALETTDAPEKTRRPQKKTAKGGGQLDLF